MSRKKDKGRTPPFVMLLNDTLDSPAWRAMSLGARVLYAALKRQYWSNLHNNGRVWISHRTAQKKIGRCNRIQISRWFRELQFYGFIVMTQAGCLGSEGTGKAPHWRLTECGYMKDEPTRDFMRWDGTVFRDEQPRLTSLKSRTRRFQVVK